MLIGAEALVRLQSETGELIPPFLFIHILEETGLIPKLDLYVFEEVCKFIKSSEENNLPLIRISVNISRCDISDKTFIEKLESIRKSYGVSPKHIHVEITETAIIEGETTIIDAVNQFHKLGYTVEMDDFGSGYSSLNVLKNIDFDVLKLDLKFIRGAINNSRGGTILSSVIRMAKWLQIPVIAEGVETLKQADFLKSIGCNYI